MKTLAQQLLPKLANICDTQAGGLSLSNKHQSLDVVSYRVWGTELKIKDFTELFARLQVKPVQPLRWYEQSAGKGRLMAADMIFSRNLGCGQSVNVAVEILHSGIIMLRLTTHH